METGEILERIMLMQLIALFLAERCPFWGNFIC